MSATKRVNIMEDKQLSKKPKRECSYGDKCYRLNPAHFRDFSHAHLESILHSYSGTGDFPIPESLSLQRSMIKDQLEVIVEKKLYEPVNPEVASTTATVVEHTGKKRDDDKQCPTPVQTKPNTSTQSTKNSDSSRSQTTNDNIGEGTASQQSRNHKKDSEETKKLTNENKMKDTDYRPIVPPTRRARDFLNVVVPPGGMAAKHAARAPYYVFYTTIDEEPATHRQPYSITFLELLDPSLGELRCSLQINFMVELGWLLSQYYFAGYSAKRLTILYGDDSLPGLATISSKRPNVDAHHVRLPTPFGTHHTKMMILCYEDGSLRVVVSTANLYLDDWENRTQGLWLSPRCPELGPDAMPHDGESPTQFKRSLLKYLAHYHLPALAHYVERVKRCDFTHINVFLVASVPGSHFGAEWGLARAGALLREHCRVPREQAARWPLLAQASSLGSFGKDAKVWLTGDFLHHLCKTSDPPQALTAPPQLKLIYPSLENVEQSHLGRLGGGCLPYGAAQHSKQPWLLDYLYQWKARATRRERAMPHVKSYARTSPDDARAAYFLLTSANCSKAAWGALNVGNRALRILSYEAGVLLLPQFIINEDFFSLDESDPNRLILPYDVPAVKYEAGMSPWLADYLR